MLPVIRTSRHLPDLVNTFFGQNLLDSFFSDRSWENTPSVNINENSNEFKVEVAAPGLDKGDFKINTKQNVLTISAEKEQKEEKKEENYVRREFCYTSFNRSFVLPNEIDQAKIKAEHKNGILTVVLPKKEEAKEKTPRIINIS